MDKNEKCVVPKIEHVFSDKLDYYSKVFSNIKFIGFAISLVSILGFLLVYSFLYGYYFSGNIERKISGFNVISNFIPFDIRTLTMTSFYFICIFYIIFGVIDLIKGDKENKKNMIFFLLFVAIVITIMLTLFFANDITFKSVASFSFIWVFLGIIVWFLFLIINVIFKPIIALKSSVMTLFFWIILIKLSSYLPIEEDLLQLIMVISLFVLWPVVTTLIVLFEKTIYVGFILYFSVITLILLLSVLMIAQIDINLNIGFWTCIIVSGVISTIIYKIKKRINSKNMEIVTSESNNEKVEDLQDNNKDLTEDSNDNKKGFLYSILSILYKIIVDEEERGAKLFGGAVLLLAFVLTPQLSMLTGKGIRTLNSSEIEKTEITFVNHNSEKNKVTANYYLDNNSVLYISNEAWELEIIKPINYHITPVAQETDSE